MSKIKAVYTQICIFTPKNYSTLAEFPADERRIYQAFQSVITELITKYGADIPIELSFCDSKSPDNQQILAGYGISDLPAVQIISQYADGSTAAYALSKDLDDKFLGVNWNASDVRPYLNAVLFQSKSAEQSLLCKIFPPLCSIGKYAWLAAAVYTTYETLKAEKEGTQLVWGAAAVLTWNEFIGRGGLKDFGIGSIGSRKKQIEKPDTFLKPAYLIWEKADLIKERDYMEANWDNSMYDRMQTIALTSATRYKTVLSALK